MCTAISQCMVNVVACSVWTHKYGKNRMRVQESSDSSCASAINANMNEGKNINGAEVGCSTGKPTASSHSPNCEPTDPTYALGGRLKFFKDGKFILELSHKKEGEKDSWIQVPKKSYWQPGVANSTASFSASDETSSVQLSPWQRDHCWKQTAPRRLRGAEMTFRMTPFPAAIHIRETHKALLRRLRRRPHDTFAAPATCSNGWTRPSRAKRKGSPTRLGAVISRLYDIAQRTVFSPRKRILREMERVSIVAEEPVKRQRPRAPAASNSKGVSSYSITSLLGPRQEEESSFLRTLLRSPSPKSRRQSPLPESFQAMHPPYVYYPFQPVVPHPYYMTGSPSHSLWAPYSPLSSLPRGAGGPYSGLVPPYASPHFQYPWGAQSPECDKREDPSSDVPLNLSKHGG